MIIHDRNRILTKRKRNPKVKKIRHRRINPFVKELKEMKYAKTKFKHRKKKIQISYLLHYEPFKSTHERLRKLYRNYLNSIPK